MMLLLVVMVCWDIGGGTRAQMWLLMLWQIICTGIIAMVRDHWIQIVINIIPIAVIIVAAIVVGITGQLQGVVVGIIIGIWII